MTKRINRRLREAIVKEVLKKLLKKIVIRLSQVLNCWHISYTILCKKILSDMSSLGGLLRAIF